MLFVFVATFAASTAMAHHSKNGQPIDSIFKTGNANLDCLDGSLFGVRRACQTDNATLTVFRESSLGPNGMQNISNVLANEYTPTDLNATVESTASYSGGQETDIIYQERDNLPNDALGTTWCNDAISSTKCDQHYVAFENVNPYPGLVCHETGHAVGLRHGAGADPAVPNNQEELQCMKTALPPNNLGAHNTDQINDVYPN